MGIMRDIQFESNSTYKFVTASLLLKSGIQLAGNIHLNHIFAFDPKPVEYAAELKAGLARIRKMLTIL